MFEYIKEIMEFFASLLKQKKENKNEKNAVIVELVTEINRLKYDLNNMYYEIQKMVNRQGYTDYRYNEAMEKVKERIIICEDKKCYIEINNIKTNIVKLEEMIMLSKQLAEKYKLIWDGYKKIIKITERSASIWVMQTGQIKDIEIIIEKASKNKELKQKNIEGIYEYYIDEIIKGC